MLRLVREHIRKKAFAMALRERKGAQAGREPVIKNFAETESIGFLYPLQKGDGQPEIRSITEAFRHDGTKVYGLVVETGSCFGDDASRGKFAQECGNNGIAFVGKNVFNWAGVPVESLPEEFFARRYDLFVNLNAESDFKLDILALKADAGCIVGMHNNPKMPYNMVLVPGKVGKGTYDSAKGTVSYTEYIGVLLSYLMKINRKGDGE